MHAYPFNFRFIIIHNYLQYHKFFSGGYIQTPKRDTVRIRRRSLRTVVMYANSLNSYRIRSSLLFWSAMDTVLV